MSLRSFLKEIIRDFRGMWQVRDQTRQSSSRASFAQNVRFFPGGVRTRHGRSQALSLGSGSILSMYNWLSGGSPSVPGTSRLLFLESPNKVGMYDLTLSALTNLYTESCAGLSVVEAETRLFIAHFNSSGIATGSTKIVLPLFSGSPVDNAFPLPISTAPVLTETGAGDVTEGLHRIAYRIETRSGYPGAVSPSIGSITAGPGGVTLNFAMTIDVPSDAAFIHLMMTTADDDETFYDIPSVSIALPAGTLSWPVSINISVSDAALQLDTNNATDRFSIISGGGPRASKLVRYGNRTCYVADKKIYISDPYAAQTMAEDRNAVQIDGQRTIVTAESLGPLLVIFGFHSTFVLSGDNARYPREWAPPQRRSEHIGAPSPNAVIPAAGFDGLWVMHQTGLHFFSGSYSEIPLSIGFDEDWKRINWAAAASIQMLDDAENRILILNVPLDGASLPNYQMVIDYTRSRARGAVNPFELDYSLDVYTVSGSVTPLPSIARVRNETTKEFEVWMGRTDGTVIRPDPSSLTDAASSAPIESVWESGFILPQKQRQLSRFNGAHLDINGLGTAYIRGYGHNRQIESEAVPISLSQTPDGEAEALYQITSENATIRITTNDSSSRFELSGLTLYHKPVGTTKARV